MASALLLCCIECIEVSCKKDCLVIMQRDGFVVAPALLPFYVQVLYK